MAFLTGINMPGAVLFLHSLPGSKWREILFLPECDRTREFWEGMKLSGFPRREAARAEKILGIQKVQCISSLIRYVHILSKQTGKKRQRIGVYWNCRALQKTEDIQNDHLEFKKFIHSASTGMGVINIEKYQWPMRLLFDQAAFKNMIKAVEKTSLAYDALIQGLSICRYEYQAAALLDNAMKCLSSFGNAFPTIAASGGNACILHYEQNSDQLNKNNLLLLDFGIRCGNNVTDVSRTVPLSGRFNPLQRLLYGIVLDTQKAVSSHVRPGMTTGELDEFCWDTMETLLKKRFFSLNGKCARKYTKRPHGVSHFIHICVHDGDLFGGAKKQPLMPGMVISNEPGLYGTFSITLNGKKYRETIGIRIEDDLYITEKGCFNLTGGIPKEIDDVEQNFKKFVQNRKVKL